MNNRMQRSLFSILILLSLQGVTQVAQATGTTGFEFLRTELGPRATAMGGAFVAIPGDMNSLYYNPAGIAAIHARGGSVIYLKHLLDFHSGELVGVMPFKWGTLGLGIDYINFGEFKRTTQADPDGVTGGTFGANSVVLNLTGGTRYRSWLAVGATVKYIHSAIENYSTDAYAADFGLALRIPLPNQDHFNLGLSVANLGQTNRAFIRTKDDLPFVWRAGFGKKLAHLPLLLSGQVYQYRNDDFRWALGGELTLSTRLFLRLGFNSLGLDQKIGTDRDRIAGLNCGLGFVWHNFRLDYAFSSVGDVGSLNRLGLVAAF